jgi:hypothetical protein
LHPALRRYVGFALGRSTRPDFLRALDEDLPAEEEAELMDRGHHVWETAVWLEVSGRKLVRGADGRHRIARPAELRPGDEVLRGALRASEIRMVPDGRYAFELTSRPSNRAIYDRGEPWVNEQALREAFPDWYASFQPTREHDP